MLFKAAYSGLPGMYQPADWLSCNMAAFRTPRDQFKKGNKEKGTQNNEQLSYDCKCLKRQNRF